MRSKWVALLMLWAAISSGAQGYKLALPGYKYEFPRDYFNHEDYQTDWWYYTGNLRALDGHRFGFELTFFRQGIAKVSSSNPWSLQDLWMAHLALSDVTAQRFYHEARLNRAGPGLAGVDAEKGLVWNGNWRAKIADRDEELQGVGEKFGFGLKLHSGKSPVIHGESGLTQKAEGLGHASHYFSLTRLLTTGSVDVGGATYQVEGTSWMDHEFFTGSMAADETGWDWLSVQLDDGTELMLYRLRHRDGSIDPHSSGSYVDAQGRTEFLSANDFAMTPGGETWASRATRASYPLRWHASIAKLGLEFDVTTPLRDQELAGSFGPSYWEGTIDVRGKRGGGALHGVGYLEMTGYAGNGSPVIPQ